MSSELRGAEAQHQAREWGYDGDIDKVTYTRKATHIGCKWVWEGDTGQCVACGDIDFDMSGDADE